MHRLIKLFSILLLGVGLVVGASVPAAAWGGPYTKTTSWGCTYVRTSQDGDPSVVQTHQQSIGSCADMYVAFRYSYGSGFWYHAPQYIHIERPNNNALGGSHSPCGSCSVLST